MNLWKALHSKKIEAFILFVIIQLSIWYTGLADIIPGFLFVSWNKLQLCATIFMIGLFIINRRMPSIISWLIVGIEAWALFSTWINGGDVDILSKSKIVCLVLAVDFFSEDLRMLISVFMIIFEFMIYYNLLVCVQTGPDLYGAFYGALGYDNGFTVYLLFAYMIALLYLNIHRRSFRPYLLILAVHITVFYTWIGTGIVTIAVIDLLLVLYYFMNLKFSLLSSYLVFLGVEIGIVFLRIQNIFRFIIEDILHKDLTFTGRTYIWDRAIELFCKSPVYGYGNLTQAQESRILGDVYCHNGFLEQLFRGGIGEWFFFFLIILFVSWEAGKFHGRIIENKIVFVFIAVCVASIAESMFEHYLVSLMLLFLYVIPRSRQKQMMSGEKPGREIK